MQTTRFDGFVRGLASGASRRRVLSLLLAGGLAGTPSLLQRQEAEARCRPRNRRCGGTCCDKGSLCVNPDTQECLPLKDSCDAGDNFCADGTGATKCGNNLCFCWQTFAGKTRCGVQEISCDIACTRDRKCIDIFGAGSFCVKPKVQSGFCNNCGPNQGFCAGACPTPA